jgi:hypothetical protein
MGESFKNLEPVKISQAQEAQPSLDQRRHNANALFLIDCSQSMSGKRMRKAIADIKAAVETLPSSVKVGIRVFGEEEPTMKLGHNSRLLVPLSRNSITQIYDKLDEIACTAPGDPNNPEWTMGDNRKPIQLGPDTPTGFALQEAWDNDFTHGDGQNDVYLVTDGRWNIGKDPCKVLEVINQDNIRMRVDVDSLNAADDKKLECIAENAGGKLLHEDESSGSSNAFVNFVNESLYGQVRDGSKRSSPTSQSIDHDKTNCHCHGTSDSKAPEPASNQTNQ